MTIPPYFRLKVRSVEQVCFFELTCGTGIELGTQIVYPQTVILAYRRWREAYLNFYQSMRARVKASGNLNIVNDGQIDWRKQVAQAEAELLSEFHGWLSDGKLLEIRETLSQAVVSFNAINHSSSVYVDIFLTCYSEELSRLPWEAWEIGVQLTARKMIRIARTPASMKADIRQSSPRRTTRVLVISGDDTGLNFVRETQAIQSLIQRRVKVSFIGWQGDNLENLKEQVCQTIADNEGWDLLIFMGHSNETQITGGELAIAPNTGILITELLPYLKQAQQRGLQFALFNSCEGLSIANTLIDAVGLGQVAVMREPIHNKVAEEFLIRFLDEIKNYKDVHEAILLTCEQLKKTCHITYPSGHLVPSLFRHPDTPLFQLKPLGYCLTRREITTLLIFLCLSLLPTENLLLYPRLWVQAFYRDITHQIPQTAPLVKLVTIDEETIQRQKIAATKVHPIDRILLAKILEQLLYSQPNVIGIDYILDRPFADPKEDLALEKVVHQAIKQETWIVFASLQDPMNGRESNVVVAKSEHSLKGYIDFTDSVIEQLPAAQSCQFACPFSYILALSSELQQEPSSLLSSEQPANNTKDFRSRILNIAQDSIKNQRASPTLIFLQKHLNVPPWQRLFNGPKPIIDFSIPPEQVYDSIPAWKLLDQPIQRPQTVLNSGLQYQIPILTPGGYDEAGIALGEDTFPMPLPMAYWRRDTKLVIGAEFHAYMIHHWLHRHFVWQIPPLWLIPLAALLGKVTTMLYPTEQYWLRQGLLVTVLYGVFSLQLFVSANILLPWLLPSAVYWIYLLPSYKEKIK
ncbi:MAG: CHASE2 domain-containing protein [Microcoleaceae cyanobacterium]